MSIADVIALTKAPLTNQQLADMALEEDQAARRARAAGRHDDAQAHDREADALARLLS